MQEVKVDKRSLNGNNGTRRGCDVKPRKKKTGYYVLKDEVRAGLAARLEIVMEYYGGMAKMARELGVSIQVVSEWRKRGMVSASGAKKIHMSYKRAGCNGYRASFVRFDLRFDSNGTPLTKFCDKRQYLDVVK
ncbi:hypothetical protein [Erwinia phage Snitter]|nr:hypothetical protein [Erwinia phage Snitter]